MGRSAEAYERQIRRNRDKRRRLRREGACVECGKTDKNTGRGRARCLRHARLQSEATARYRAKVGKGAPI